jgi:hypothetical protein
MKKIRHPFVLLAAALGISCFSCMPIEQRSNNWSSWSKYNDIPGIEFRSSCLGQKYPGSRFSSCEVELTNEYTQAVDLEMTLVTPSGDQVSEIYTLRIEPENQRKVTFYNVGVDCGTDFLVSIKDVKFE